MCSGADHPHRRAHQRHTMRPSDKWPRARASCTAASGRASAVGRSAFAVRKGYCEGRRRVFLHGGIVGNCAHRARASLTAKSGGCVTIVRMQTTGHFPPALPRASISAAAMRPWRGCASISRASATSTACSRPRRGVYNYVINHPDDIKQVLLSNHRNYTKGEGMDRVKILLGNGIMTSEGDFWRRQRRMMQPVFHRRVIDRFSALIHEVNEQVRRRAGRRMRRAASRSISPTTPASSPWRSCCVRFSAPISSALGAQARRQPVRSRRQGTEPRSEVRLPLPLAHQARRGADRAPPPRARRSTTTSSAC